MTVLIFSWFFQEMKMNLNARARYCTVEHLEASPASNNGQNSSSFYHSLSVTEWVILWREQAPSKIEVRTLSWVQPIDSCLKKLEKGYYRSRIIRSTEIVWSTQIVRITFIQTILFPNICPKNARSNIIVLGAIGTMNWSWVTVNRDRGWLPGRLAAGASLQFSRKFPAQPVNPPSPSCPFGNN